MIDMVKEGIKEDLVKLYDNISSSSVVEDFYFPIIASNPKFYSTSGLQHYLGTAFLAFRISQHLSLDDYSSATAFLSGLLHDANKWGIPQDEIVKRFENTKLFSIFSEFFGEEKTKKIIKDSMEIAKTLERGGSSRNLQKISEAVRISDYISGDERSWKISRVIDILRNSSLINIGYEHIYPIYLGRQRLVTVYLSHLVKDELIERGMIPLITSSEGMIFLRRSSVSITYDDVIKRMIPLLSSGFRRSKTKSPDASKLVRALEDCKMNLSRSYESLSGYDYDDLLEGLEEAKISRIDHINYLLTLIYVLQRPEGKEHREKREKIFRKISEILNTNLSSSKLCETLITIRDVLMKSDDDFIRRFEEKILEMIREEMREKEVKPDLLRRKISRYISLPREEDVSEDNITRRCPVCGEEILEARPLSAFLKELKKIVGKINTVEIFLPGIQGSPDRPGSIEKLGHKTDVCETCFFEIKELMPRLGLADGLWSAVLTYYPNISIDLADVISNSIKTIVGLDKSSESYKIVPDYMSGRILVGISVRGKGLDKKALSNALKVWLIFGGNMFITTNPLTSPPLIDAPIRLEVGDMIFLECSSKYLEILKKASAYSSYLSFTSQMRYWLFTSLLRYVSSLETTSSGSDAMFRRSFGYTTGFCTLDVLSSESIR
jgi:hypothetical protein